MDRYSYPDTVRAALEGLQQPLGIYQSVDNRVLTVLVSDGFCRLFGYTEREQAVRDMDHAMYKNTHADDRDRLVEAAKRFAAGEGEYDVIYRTKAGVSADYRVIHARGRHVTTETGIRLAQVWYMDEGLYIEGEESAGSRINREYNSVLHEQSILRTANYDPLTGLPNLAHFFKLCELGKERAFREGKQGCLLYLDLNGMKYFNYRKGFAAGDKLLRSFADILAQTFGHENACHIGGDRFAAFSTDEGLKDRLRRFFAEVEQLDSYLPVRVGIYSTGVGDVPVSTAYDRAKITCDSIPKSNSSRFRRYTSELSDARKMRHYFQSNIDRAIAEKWIQVYYQPIVRAVNGQVCDVEALARWIDPTEGFLSPAQFIPYLEETEQIYKLDLYVLEQVLEKIKQYAREGMFLVPHSINLSRSDFDACDIVEEVRKRVDAAGVSRESITVEITESMIGSDFEYMKTQVGRFQELGFPVWMDDFGSGYSSLDVLQSIRFNLIKFDMGFMRKLDEGDSGKIMLTELMRMATALGVDTVCEGVETEKQVRFLQEIGCSKLQGYYYGKPIPLEEIRREHDKTSALTPENPRESEYYETIGRVNLNDLSVLANLDENLFQNAFNTIPMGIIEIKDDTTRFVRSNRTYNAFIKRFYGLDLTREGSSFAKYDNSFMYNVVKVCCEQGNRSFYDEKMPDGSVVHSFARRIGINPVNGNFAVAIAVLSVSPPEEAATYGDIARALAADYYNMFIVDLDTDRFIEYSSPVGGQVMAVERHGDDFFGINRHSAHHVYEEDQAAFYEAFTKEKIIQALDEHGVLNLTYRLVDKGVPEYVNMKITRMQSAGNRIIIGISVVDAQMRKLEEEKRLRQERTSLGRIAALSPDYIVLYTVDPATGHYTQYNPSNAYESFGLAPQGEDFFADVMRDAEKAVDPRDLERHRRAITKDNMLREIQKNGFFVCRYRLLLNGQSVPVSLKATLVEENDRETILLGVLNDYQSGAQA